MVTAVKTATKTGLKSYCFPQERPATKQELAEHIKKAESYGRGMTEEEFERKFDEFVKKF